MNDGRLLGRVLRLGLLIPPILIFVWLFKPPEAEPEPRTVHILAVNDLYRIEGLRASGEGGLARLRSLRLEKEAEDSALLVLHAGDFLYPSLLSRTYDGEQMVDLMNRLDGDSVAFDRNMVVTFGNHEFEKESAGEVGILRNRVLESQFWWVGSDLPFLDSVVTPDTTLPGVRAPHLRRSLIRDVKGVKVGIFSLTLVEGDVGYLDMDSVPGTVPEWTAVARSRMEALRGEGVDLVIGLTHLPMEKDIAVLEALGDDGPDLVIGGHEHDHRKEIVAGTPILKADADARTAWWVTVTLNDTMPPTVQDTLLDLDAGVPPDTALTRLTEHWLIRHDREFCGDPRRTLPAGCLNHPLATTEAPWEAEELLIRNRETGIGDWIAQRVLEAAAKDGLDARVAIINSGALRLNQNLPEGTVIERRHVEEFIEYDDSLVVLPLPAPTLTEAFRRSVRCRGTGPWLQIAGASFRYDPIARALDSVWVGGAPLEEDDTVAVVTLPFLASGGDGYGMLQGIIPGGTLSRSLKEVIYDAVTASPTRRMTPTLVASEALQPIGGMSADTVPCG